MHKHSSSLGLCLRLISFTGLSNTHTNTFPPPLPLAPISLICSNIIIILLLINHRDREGATLHLSTGTHRFPSSPSPFHHRPPRLHSLSRSFSPSLWDPHTAPHQHWRTSTAVLSPRVCFFFFFFISTPNWHVQQQGGARPRSNSRPLVNLLTISACTTGDTRSRADAKRKKKRASKVKMRPVCHFRSVSREPTS